MHVLESYYYDTPLLVDFVTGGLAWSEQTGFDDDGTPLTVQARCLQSAINAYHPEVRNSAFGSHGREGVFYKFSRNGKPVSDALAQAAQREAWRNLLAKARSECWAGLGGGHEGLRVAHCLAFTVHPEDVALVPGAFFDPAARGGPPIRATAMACRLAVFYAARDGLGEVDHGRERGEPRSVHVPVDAQDLLGRLADLSGLSTRFALQAAFESYAHGVRTGRYPRPRHLPTDYDHGRVLVPGPPRGPALAVPRLERKRTRWERQGYAGTLPAEEQIRFDQERQLGYWAPEEVT